TPASKTVAARRSGCRVDYRMARMTFDGCPSRRVAPKMPHVRATQPHQAAALFGTVHLGRGGPAAALFLAGAAGAGGGAAGPAAHAVAGVGLLPAVRGLLPVADPQPGRAQGH